MSGSDFAFPSQTLAFLAGLKAHNEKAWFEAHRADYDAGFKRAAEVFCGVMAGELEALTGIGHASKVFRIHRDVRFSKDKTPYNAHLHISFHPADGPAARPGWFFGLTPEQMTVGAGVFGLDGANLDRFRARIDGPDGGDLAAMVASLESCGYRLWDPELKRVPAPYPADHPRSRFLRHKSLTAWKDFPSPQDATKPGLIAAVTAGFADLKPLFDWLMAAEGA